MVATTAVHPHLYCWERTYAMLRRASNDHNVKLRDLAQTVTETGALP